MSAPERIWIPIEADFGLLPVKDPHNEEHPYILATPEALAASPEVQALVDAAVKAERERCVTALARACDAEIEQAKKLGPMHVPIIIAVKHDCIAAIRAGEGAT